ncbi:MULTISPECIES: M48 family metallopeptidase [unclassified Bacillus (in: firmicutes)]|uniref:M48 family metallopeptidase n=1 Tax=unclassified Bacillus (in: firmicutes) TaxID=185979 RepID=UPI0003FE0CAE|nr:MULTISPECIES: M48 family metallopeptidase [unclassified Bacillus (in: firmicutes)]QHZ46130.1 M48 family metallopeptidase [Bacillus sp. NSP9.1]WFA06357.1 M48 family metallopeptidase [Bacillus sp. HSf4]
MGKWIAGAGLLYVLYGLFFYWYLFMTGESSVPEALKGTSADPATFMNQRELILSEEYSKIKDFLFFFRIPFEWFLFFILLTAGLSKKMKDWAEQTSRRRFIQIAAYVFCLFLIVALASLPLDWISYQYSLDYGISTQTTASWIKDQVIDFWISFPLTLGAVLVFFWLIKKHEKRWWFYAWCLTVPVTLFLFFLQPVVIDPLYNDFYPLKNKELEHHILKLADQADIPANHVYEVNMSEKTNALNAYVTGIGANKRIVLWDTTLNKLDEPEILFIMAHEMGHYVMKHVYIGLGGYLLLSLAGLFVIDKIYKWIIRRHGRRFNIKSKADLAALPLLLLLIGVVSFASSPFTNAVSRHQEKAADQYAIELTKNKKAAVSTFQELSKAGLSEANPPFLVKIFKYGHPTIMERIQNVEQGSK